MIWIPQEAASLPQDCRTAVALGFFDGVHRGHEAVIRPTLDHPGLSSAVFTFTVHDSSPAAKQKQRMIQSLKLKGETLEELGVEYLFCPDFDSFRSLSPEQFVSEMLVGQFHAGAVYCGEDFRFGAKASGDTTLLRKLCKEHGIEMTVVAPVYEDGKIISSTRIRQCLMEGNIPEANRLLGRPFALEAEVVYGKQLGRELSFPTINQQFPEDQMVPKNGVYAVLANVDGCWIPGTANVGRQPTVDGKTILSETYLLDFDGDLYGKTITLRFFTYLRPERKFSSLEELTEAIRRSVQETRRYFDAHPESVSATGARA